ncbi:hypothetical protein C2845_PM02G22330 [Panicum miliaceum]|uniref:F-box domain-containing protein n=1 Tax=Panicum miliaceum TaxID=4540 RepID=A0A3L6SE58_PANMI|nr:hypothetical protein C2845_PM02G22330 [Panicum miliaceum]
MDSPRKSACAAGDLTDDLIVEILSRLPAKSICRFKCVSWHWYGLITNPEHRKKIPQTLSGFFYPSVSWTPEDSVRTFPDFVDIVGDLEPFSDPSLTFMASYRSIVPKICCNGLLFCFCWKVSPRDECDLVVCNPATEKWVVLPDSVEESIALKYHFVFDLAISPHFQVFEITDADENYGYIGDVNIYSSETGPLAFIGQSQGRLYYINMRVGDTSKLSVWILDDYDSGEWIFKYNISTAQISGEKNLMFERDYALIAIHPESNLIFFVCRCKDMLISYDMDRGKVCVSNLKEHLCDRPFLPYLPYVPFLKDSLAAQGWKRICSVEANNCYPEVTWMPTASSHQI